MKICVCAASHPGRSKPFDFAQGRLYLGAVRQLAAHYQRSPDQLSEEELRQYFLYLTDVKRVSASTLTLLPRHRLATAPAAMLSSGHARQHALPHH